MATRISVPAGEHYYERLQTSVGSINPQSPLNSDLIKQVFGHQHRTPSSALLLFGAVRLARGLVSTQTPTDLQIIRRTLSWGSPNQRAITHSDKPLFVGWQLLRNDIPTRPKFFTPPRVDLTALTTDGRLVDQARYFLPSDNPNHAPWLKAGTSPFWFKDRTDQFSVITSMQSSLPAPEILAETRADQNELEHRLGILVKMAQLANNAEISIADMPNPRNTVFLDY